MSTNDFNNLSGYVNQIDNLTEKFYEDKQDVNKVEDDQLSTHVTADDLNIIKDTLTTLCNNVNDINRYLVNADLTTLTNGNNISVDQDLNQFLSNDYVRKNQIIVNGSPANDSSIYFDDIYLRSSNIFVDGFKVSNTSPYNLVSWNEFNSRLDAINNDFDIDSIINSIKESIRNVNGIVIDALNTFDNQVIIGTPGFYETNE